ncbi:hypothetical protein [Nostoc sp. C117]
MVPRVQATGSHQSTVNRQQLTITLYIVKAFIEAPLILDTKD